MKKIILNAKRIEEFNEKHPHADNGPLGGKKQILNFMDRWVYIEEDSKTLNLLKDLILNYTAELQDVIRLNNLEKISPKSFNVIFNNLSSIECSFKKIDELDEQVASLFAKGGLDLIQFGRIKFLSRKTVKVLSSFDIIINHRGLAINRLDSLNVNLYNSRK